jgi:hypothetical protein
MSLARGGLLSMRHIFFSTKTILVAMQSLLLEESKFCSPLKLRIDLLIFTKEHILLLKINKLLDEFILKKG